MSKVELTPAKLAQLKQKAEAAETQGQSPWRFVKIEEEYHTYCEVRDMYGYQVVEDSTQEEAEHIAEADPATVLALVEEIETLKRALQELTWDLCGIDLEQEQIDKICSEWIDKAKMLLKSEATP